MGRSLRPGWLALGVSLLLHISLFGSLSWTFPQWVVPSGPLPIDVQLVPVVTPARVSSAPRRTPPAAKQTRPQHPAAPTLRPRSDSLIEPLVGASGTVAELNDGIAGVEETPPVDPKPLEVVPPPLNPLPPRLDLRFQVRYGPVSGEQTLLWVNEGERYTVISVAEATGLAGMFYHGRFVQTSRGRITPRGLQPEEFWDQRGDTRSSAHFDAAQGHLTLTPAIGAPRHFDYQGEVQDVASLWFQLALTSPPPEGRLTYRVFNGKKLRDYTYEV